MDVAACIKAETVNGIGPLGLLSTKAVAALDAVTVDATRWLVYGFGYGVSGGWFLVG
jgi:hypothetical protein